MAVATLLQGIQGVPTTDVRVCPPCICLRKAARLPRDQRAMTLHFIARLPQECCKMYDYRCKSHNGRTTALWVLYDVSLCLANLHNHLAAALHVNVR